MHGKCRIEINIARGDYYHIIFNIAINHYIMCSLLSLLSITEHNAPGIHYRIIYAWQMYTLQGDRLLSIIISSIILQ